MLSDQELVLLDRHTTTTRQIRVDVDEWIQQFWLDFDLSNAVEVEQAVPLIAGRVEAASMRVAASTDMYLSSTIAVATGTTPRVLGVSIEDVATFALRGISSSVMYRRPMNAVFASLAAGVGVESARALGMERMRKIAATNIQLAKTHTARSRMRKEDGIAGYRRVLNGPKNCGLCIVASTQRYHVGDLQPIHPGCDCTVAPIIGDRDPGQVIDPGRLENAHGALEATFGKSDSGARQFASIDDEIIWYRDVLVVNQHGEIGPVLGVRGHSWRNADDYPR